MGTDIYLHVEHRTDDGWEYCGKLDDLEVRHYAFFAILADVRNPIRSTEPFAHISSRRGFPDDMCKEIQSDGLLMTGHDPGWVSLRELLDFDWDGRTIMRSAVVPPEAAEAFGDGKQNFPRDRLPPNCWFAESGPGPRVTWIETYREAVGEKFLKELTGALAKFGSPDDVRIIFSFDS